MDCTCTSVRIFLCCVFFSAKKEESATSRAVLESSMAPPLKIASEFSPFFFFK